MKAVLKKKYVQYSFSEEKIKLFTYQLSVNCLNFNLLTFNLHDFSINLGHFRILHPYLRTYKNVYRRKNTTWWLTNVGTRTTNGNGFILQDCQ